MPQLLEVEHAGPVVERRAPDREGPAEDAGQQVQRAVAVAEQEQRERVEQAEGRGLAEEVHRQRVETAAVQRRQREGQQQVPQRQRDRQPPRDDVAQRQTDHGGEDVQPVGHRVEHLAEAGGLVHPARDLAVGPVGEAGDRQHQQRPAVLLRPEHQPQEQRHSQQPEEAERVRDREHPVGHFQVRHAPPPLSPWLLSPLGAVVTVLGPTDRAMPGHARGMPR
jgi:hypothetical protein